MYLACLDLEGVLVPEIWIAVAEAVGVPELKRTTRDEPDYGKLMAYRIALLNEHGLGYREIERVISEMRPLDGAKAFLDELRSFAQVVIVSDTFDVFARPLMKQLGWPTIFCHELLTDEKGRVTGWKSRLDNHKEATVRGLQAIGFDTIATGDSFNDLAMIRAGKQGFLFRTTPAIRDANPDLPALETYEELLSAFRKAMGLK